MVERRSGPIAYWESGPPGGTPVVLLHGFLSSARQWRRTLERNADLRLLAPDLPGHGRSALPREALSPARYAESMEAWARRVGLGAVALVGHSMGGLVAVDWCARHPGRAVRLGLCAPAGAPHDFRPALPTWPLRVPGLRGLFVRLLTARPVARRIFGGITRSDPEADARVAADFLWSVRHAREAFRNPRFYDYPELAERLGSIRVPVEILWGVEDAVLPASDVHAFAPHLSDCRVTLLPGCGHAPPVERPAEFDAFLRRAAGVA
jgi:abhydrolase domain-containing protein 6